MTLDVVRNMSLEEYNLWIEHIKLSGEEQKHALEKNRGPKARRQRMR